MKTNKRNSDKQGIDNVVTNVTNQKNILKLINSSAKRISLNGLICSALSLVVKAVSSKTKGIHIVILDSKDDAGYFYWDLHNFIEESKLLFFPTGYTRSIIYGRENASGIVQRTAVISALKNYKKGDNLVICTYPEAISEKVVTSKELNSKSFIINKGDKLKQQIIIDMLLEFGFARVDFVHEPGQFSVRGGIIDIFSFSSNYPARLDMFGDEIESIRSFDINSQRSVNSLDYIDVIANLKYSNEVEELISITGFINDKCKNDDFYLWADRPTHIIKKIGDTKNKFLKNALEKNNQDFEKAKHYVTGVNEFYQQIKDSHIFTVRDTFVELQSEEELFFDINPQPSFNKNFELLIKALKENTDKGYKNYIITENKAQVERLENIFYSLGIKTSIFENISLTLHEGFIDNDNKVCFYTDHQIFERHHRYRIGNELPKSEAMSISELNALRPGDFVTHIDHGVGRFGGLIRSEENGKMQELIKLVYKDGDILLVNVHSLHKISKFKDAENGINVKVHKLGSGTWQRLKLTTKNKIKDIAKDLIKLYAERKASKGFAFSHDTYLQNELEASFIYEDTPDQEKATRDFKKDMETPQPMDRLVCGDVGFGKTEIAIRAAFKAATDGKQVAVLVPTTVLSLQHYRTFSRRLKEFPITIENLSRVKTAKQTKEICEKLKKGHVDILIGTHKILGKGVEFKDLGLLIVDEEQKFGVAAKEKLRTIKQNVDTLTLSATPIPRTLQFSLMGARDLSIINTPPPNRQPVETIVHEFNTALIKEAIEEELSRSGQVYFLHNKVQSIEHISSVIKDLVPDARIAIAHGQMPADKLEKIMMDFIYGEYDILVATTIIESGIDIENANTMIINNAHNFGLSDLHQLRGRVGRTNKKAYCYLLTPQDTLIPEIAARRLKVIEDFSDLGSGFNISMQDLDIRGAGNILGGEQSGFISDIGYETYQKIVTEAMMELKEENYIANTDENNDTSDNEDNILCGSEFVSDCRIDISSEAYIPDEYVSQTNEKIKLYKTIDSITTEEQANEIREMLRDRFGEIPKVTDELLNVAILRKIAISLGFEKAIIKNGYFILDFVSNSKSQYYDKPLFSRIMSTIPQMGIGFKLKQTTNRLFITISAVRDVSAALRIITDFSEKIINNKMK
ncbi:MAG: transcription-repair coupling factor [Rikenellaceae bacterium]